MGKGSDQAKYNTCKSYKYVFRKISVADPGSDAFLTPGSGIRDGRKIKIRIRDGHPESYFRKLRTNFCLVKILRFFDVDADPGSENLFEPGSGIRDKQPGSATLENISVRSFPEEFGCAV
jgi:hypothetical protein